MGIAIGIGIRDVCIEYHIFDDAVRGLYLALLGEPTDGIRQIMGCAQQFPFTSNYTAISHTAHLMQSILFDAL